MKAIFPISFFDHFYALKWNYPPLRFILKHQDNCTFYIYFPGEKQKEIFKDIDVLLIHQGERKL